MKKEKEKFDCTTGVAFWIPRIEGQSDPSLCSWRKSYLSLCILPLLLSHSITF